jgi:hypothetical protein
MKIAKEVGMIHPEWKPGALLHVTPDFSLYDDGEDHTVAIFFHDPSDDAGVQLEAKLRRQIQDYLDEVDVISLLREQGEAALALVIPVPNTTDVVGLLKGEVEFNPRFKHLGDFVSEDLHDTVTFMGHWSALIQDEERRMAAYRRSVA